VGTDRQLIFREVQELLSNEASHQTMAQARNPYGDGQAAERIFRILACALAGQTWGLPDLKPWEPQPESRSW
jgi:UDP-N-acetylglucosamine 2-epimerase